MMHGTAQRNARSLVRPCMVVFTCGDIFSNSPDRDGCTFYPISIKIFNYSLYSSMDLFRNRTHNNKTWFISLSACSFVLDRVIMLASREQYSYRAWKFENWCMIQLLKSSLQTQENWAKLPYSSSTLDKAPPLRGTYHSPAPRWSPDNWCAGSWSLTCLQR